MFSVLTLNIFAGAPEMDFDRLHQQIEEVHKLDPDIICLQEVFDSSVREAYQSAFSTHEVFAKEIFRPSWFRLLIRLLPLSRGIKNILLGDSLGLVTLVRKSKFEALEFQARPFTAQVSHRWSLPRLLEISHPRGFSLLKIIANDRSTDAQSRSKSGFESETDSELCVVNALLSNGVQNPRRKIQLEEILTVLPKSHPTVVCIDANSHEDQPEMKWFIHQQGFEDTFRNSQTSPGYTWSSTNPLTAGFLKEPDQRVDYVFAKGLQAKSSQCVFDHAPFVSDHFGVFSEFHSLL